MKIKQICEINQCVYKMYEQNDRNRIVEFKKKAKKRLFKFFLILGLIGSAVLTFIGYKQTNRQAKFIYILYNAK